MRKLAVMTLVAVFALSLAVPAMARIDMTGQVTSRVNSLETENGDEEMGFQDALANVQIMGDVASGVSAFAELQYDGSATAGQEVDVDEAYITLDELAGPVDVKMGQFNVNFGNQKNYYSDNADVQSNPLVGNPIVTPVSVEQGVELSGVYGPAAWSLGYTNGTSGDQFATDSAMAMSAKIWGDLTPLAPGLSAAFSYYSVDQSDAGAGNSVLFDEDLAAAPYNYMAIDVAEATVTDSELDAMQLDLGYDLAEFGVPANLTAFYGDISTAGDDFATYMSFEGTYDLTPAATLAARFGEISPESDANDATELLQAGLNYEVAPGTLAKLEYVDRSDNDDKGNNFDGVVGELSVSF